MAEMCQVNTHRIYKVQNTVLTLYRKTRTVRSHRA